MLQVSPWARIITILIVLGGLLIALPNALSDRIVNRFPSWMPKNSVSLGLDLQGGSYLLLEAQLDQVQKDKTEAMIGGFKAPAKRVGFFWHRTSDVTPDGRKLFSAAVAWSLTP